MVNNRTKIISKCRVRKKYAWANYDDMDWNMGFKIRFLEFFFFFFFFCDNIVYNLCEADTRFRSWRGHYDFPQIFTVGDGS